MTEPDKRPDPAPDADDAPRGFLAKFRTWHLVAVVTLMALVSYIDRGGIFLVIDPIKKDLNVTDFQMSLVIGFAFVALYTVFAIPAGYMADRWNRKLVLFIGIFFSGVAAVASGFATTYGQLFAARVALGVAEAALPPAANSLIRDGVPRKQQGRAFAIYAIGSVWGVALGTLSAGITLGAAHAGFFEGIPILGGMRSWQLVLAVPALCCMPIIVLLATMREPARRSAPSDPLTGRNDGSTYVEAFKYLATHWRMYLPIVSSSTLGLLAMGGWGAWIYTAVARQWEIPGGEIAKTAGVISLICIPIASVTAGWLMDFFSKGVKTEVYLLVPFFGVILHVIPALGILFAPSVKLMWVCWVLAALLSISPLAATGTVMAAITPSRLMGKITSLYFLIANLLGFSIGPTVFAAVALLFPEKGDLGIVPALAIGYPALMAIKMVLMLVAARQVYVWRTHPEMIRPV